jgi:hypothetical protein
MTVSDEDLFHGAPRAASGLMGGLMVRLKMALVKTAKAKAVLFYIRILVYAPKPNDRRLDAGSKQIGTFAS